MSLSGKGTRRLILRGRGVLAAIPSVVIAKILE
jgi:hypothetical protein